MRDVKRRDFIGLSGAVLASWPSLISAAPLRKNYRMGYLALSDRVPWIDGMIDGLRELGYVEGQNLLIEWRLAAGKQELLHKMATDLVESKVDLIVVPGDLPASIAKNLRSPIPILAVATHDGVGVGLYDSLAQPGQNITGLESLAPELDAKRIQFLKEIIPSLGRLAILYNSSDNGSRIHLPLIDTGAKKLGIETHLFEISSLADFVEQFESISKWNPDALLTVPEPVIINQRKRIVEFCIEHRIPNAHEIREFVKVGGLLSYGASFYGIWHRSAYYIDKLLNGVKPSELPVELPTVFDLAINLQSARALNLNIPGTLIASADFVVE
jgi:putative ABC transport system substrate-binding protein